MSDYVDNGSFKFGNIDLFNEFGLRLINVIGDSLSPKLRERKVVIPSRSGAYDYGAKYYDEREVTLECASMVNLSRAEWRELSYILSKKDRLYIFNEPDKYYVGRIYDPAMLEPIKFAGMQFELVFICEPFAYSDVITKQFSTVLEPNYKGTADTPTRIEIVNTGTKPIVGINVMIITRKD